MSVLTRRQITKTADHAAKCATLPKHALRGSVPTREASDLRRIINNYRQLLSCQSRILISSASARLTGVPNARGLPGICFDSCAHIYIVTIDIQPPRCALLLVSLLKRSCWHQFLRSFFGIPQHLHRKPHKNRLFYWRDCSSLSPKHILHYLSQMEATNQGFSYCWQFAMSLYSVRIF